MMKRGLGERKHSRKREAILALLRSTGTHPGARWIHEQLKSRIPDLSLGTVYRNLGFFRETGKAACVGVVNGEERFDAITTPHPHWICEACGRILDLPCPEGEAIRPFPGLQEGGYQTDYRKTVFYGHCPECSTKTGIS